MTIANGTRLGPNEILAPIGAGGMGEVYKARDTRLDRIVALKVSKTEFNPRSGQEARAVAALNHPNICALYDVGPDYLVMEYVDGAELKSPLPVARAVELACQILDPLSAAHKRGITHRDLKPANIMVTKSGVKVLNFGLAKMGRAESIGGDGSTTLTAEGAIVSTGGGAGARWRSDSREVFYGTLDDRIMAADVTAKGTTLEVGKPHALFGPISAADFDVSADGHRFLMSVPVRSGPESLTVVQNWMVALTN
jgi:serine/threonine protein kinase